MSEKRQEKRNHGANETRSKNRVIRRARVGTKGRVEQAITPEQMRVAEKAFWARRPKHERPSCLKGFVFGGAKRRPDSDIDEETL